MPDVVIRVPRRVWRRRLVFVVGRLLLFALARVRIQGRANRPPKRGPLIVAANHHSPLDVFMMSAYPLGGRQIEIIGNDDIPLVGALSRIRPWLNRYGFIPIRRGVVDRAALNMALAVLKQGGVVGIFPEGGLWDASGMQARTGVAWLSQKSGAPILPVAFGGTRDGLNDLFGLRRPRLTVRIGPLIPAVESGGGAARRDALEQGAALIMARIADLLPPEEQTSREAVLDEQFELALQVIAADGSLVDLPSELAIREGGAVAGLIYRCGLMDTLARNLDLPVEPLRGTEARRDPSAVAVACAAIIDYLRGDPGFLTYRLGQKAGSAAKIGLIALREAALWAAAHGHHLEMTPIRRYIRADNGEAVTERHPNC
jgi:1-acyl-sn-glycerol-3-phosphate acyltransferase